MSQAPRLSDTVRELITKAVLDNPDMPRHALAKKLEGVISATGQRVPSEDTLVKMISSTRTKFGAKPDRPWSLAVSLDENLPPSVTMALLKAFRMTQALDEPFPTSEARWVAYLSTVISDTGALLYWANQYATYEKSHKLLHGIFDSCDLDAALVMDPCEHAIAALLGKVMPVPAPGTEVGVLLRPNQIQDSEQDAYFAAAVAEQRALNPISANDPRPPGTPLQIPDETKQLSPLKELNLPVHAIWVYTHWLTALSKGPKWRKMRRQDILDMMEHLRQWTSSLPDLQEEVGKSLQELIDQKKAIHFRDFPYRLEFVPHHLVKKAGFPADSPLTSPGNWGRIHDRHEDFRKNVHKLKRNQHDTQKNDGSKEVKK